MADPKSKVYPVSMNVAMTEAMRDAITEHAHDARMNGREFIRFCISQTITTIEDQRARALAERRAAAEAEIERRAAALAAERSQA